MTIHDMPEEDVRSGKFHDAWHWLWSKARKPEPREQSLEDSVRKALRLCVEGIEPPVKDDEFESLYEDVLEGEVHNRRNASELIDDFIKRRNATRRWC